MAEKMVQKNASPHGPISCQAIERVNKRLWQDIDEIKKISGYNQYVNKVQKEGRRSYMTLDGWICHLKYIYDKNK